MLALERRYEHFSLGSTGSTWNRFYRRAGGPPGTVLGWPTCAVLTVP